MTATTFKPEHFTLYFREGSSDKVYRVSLEANGSPDRFVVNFAFGRRGSTLQTGTKTPAPVDYDTASAIFRQVVLAKCAKGYTPGANGTPYQHTENEGRSTGIHPQLLEPVADTYALGLPRHRPRQIRHGRGSHPGRPAGLDGQEAAVVRQRR